MKKLLLIIATLSLVSCSNDPLEFDNTQNPKITAERVPGISAALPDAWELELSGNVLNKIKINTSQEDTFTYSGSKIVEVNHFSNSVFNAVDEFTYDTSGNLISITNKNASDVITLTREFNYSNPSLIEEVVTLFDASGNITGTYTVFKNIVNGNLLQYNFEDSQLDTYVYDTKENVFSNLESLNELVLYYSNDRVGRNNRTGSSSEFYYNGNLLNATAMTFLNEYDTHNKINKRSVLLSGVEHYKEIFSYN